MIDDYPDLAYPRLAFLHPRWMDRAACLDAPSTDFFPEDRWGAEKAKEVCEDCCVATICLEYAIAEDITEGVWGGASANDRKRMRQARGL